MTLHRTKAIQNVEITIRLQQFLTGIPKAFLLRLPDGLRVSTKHREPEERTTPTWQSRTHQGSEVFCRHHQADQSHSSSLDSNTFADEKPKDCAGSGLKIMQSPEKFRKFIFHSFPTGFSAAFFHSNAPCPAKPFLRRSSLNFPGISRTPFPDSNGFLKKVVSGLRSSNPESVQIPHGWKNCSKSASKNSFKISAPCCLLDVFLDFLR